MHIRWMYICVSIYKKLSLNRGPKRRDGCRKVHEFDILLLERCSKKYYISKYICNKRHRNINYELYFVYLFYFSFDIHRFVHSSIWNVLQQCLQWPVRQRFARVFIVSLLVNFTIYAPLESDEEQNRTWEANTSADWMWMKLNEMKTNTSKWSDKGNVWFIIRIFEFSIFFSALVAFQLS